MGGRANPLRDAAAIVERRRAGVGRDGGRRGRAAPLDVRVDWDRCMGSGNCVFWAPETFDLSDDGHAVVVDAAATDEERLRTAAQGCPVGAISLWRAGAEVPLEEST